VTGIRLPRYYDGLTIGREQEAEGVKTPAGMRLDELALRVLIATHTRQIPCLR
jgi:hypothetical protein